MMIAANIKIIQPRRIRLEASTACQLKCPSCPTASGETGKRLGVGFLKFDDFKRIVDENTWVAHIELSNWGEIFLNKDLMKIMKYAYEHNVALYATNGVNLNTVKEDTLKALVKYKFRKMTCSIDGASQETYSLYRVKGDFDVVIDNIKTINKWKAKYRSSYPILKWQFVAFGHNEHEITKAREMAEKLNMKFYLKLSWGDLYTTAFSPVKDADLIRKETGLGAASREEYQKKYGVDYMTRNCCLELWRGPQINHDGKVLGCCINYWDDYGNVFKEGLRESLNNEKINYARDMLMGKRGARADIPCTRCKVYAGRRKNNDWVTDKEIEESYYSSRKYVMLENKFLGAQLTKRLAHSWHKGKKGFGTVKRMIQGGRVKDFSPIIKPASINQKNVLPSKIYPLIVPLELDFGKAWKPYPLFKGATIGTEYFSCHASVLVKGHIPHPPHTHKEEEILMVLKGEADVILPKINTPEGDNRIRLKSGQFVYYPAGFPHTLEAVSEAPNYLMFKWYAPLCMREEKLNFGQFNALDSFHETESKAGFHSQLIFQGKTGCLNKLHCHISTLSPGAGYKPHVDAYDVAIIVLEGEVETLGKRVGPYSVIFYAAGEPHGMSNPTNVKAKYIVFEFHGNNTRQDVE